MMLLPKDVGPFTLVRKLGTGAVAESYLGTLHDGEHRPVVVRRILPYILRDPPRLASLEARVRDLMGVRHPFLVQVLDWVEDGQERFIVEARVDGVDLDRVLSWCRANSTPLPHNVFLNLSTQVCNGLEALHGRPGRGSGADNVLHLGLRPGAVHVNREGKVVLGGYGLTRSPTALSHGGVSAPVPARMEYLSPEQTQPDQKLAPASDIFSLGSVLYELFTLEPLFRSDSNLQTINRVRKAEVTSQLLKVKEMMPGLDKILYRALSLNPRHRYQRAFVLREDLRGLMAGYSFASIVEDTQAFFAPMLSEQAEATALAPEPEGVPEVSSAPVVPPAPPAVPAPAAVQQAVVHEVAVQEDLSQVESLFDDPASGLGDDLDVTRVGATSEGGLAAEMAGQMVEPDLSPSTADTMHDTGEEDLAAAAVVASPGAASPPIVPRMPDLPPVDEFSDEVATRIEHSPASTAALAAEAVRAHLDAHDAPADTSEGTAETEQARYEHHESLFDTSESGTAETEHADVSAPVDEVQPSAPALDEDLADRSTLPLPPGSPGLEEDTDMALMAAGGAAVASAAASTRAFLGKADIPAEPPPVPVPAAPRDSANSTRAFLRGESVDAPPPPPTAAPDPSSSGVGDRLSTRAPAPPKVPGIADRAPRIPSNRADEAPPPPVAMPTAVPAPTVQPAAAPPQAPSPARPAASMAAASPPATPPPSTGDLDDDDDIQPKRGNGMMVGVAALVAVLVLACGVGGYTLSRVLGEAAEDATNEALAGLEAATEEAATEAAEAEAALAEADAEEPSVEDALAEAAEEAEPPVAARELEPEPVAAAPVRSSGSSSSSSSGSSYGSSSASSGSRSGSSGSSSSWSGSSGSSSSRGSSSTTSGSSSRGSSASPSWSSGRSGGDDALADLDVGAEPAEGQPVRIEDIERYAAPATDGRLSSSDVLALEMVELDDPAYTRSRALLVMNSQRNGDEAAAKRYLDQLMRLPENQYNPVYLSDLGRYYVNKKQYDRALEKADLAERYWARLPPELVFTKKAEIYETQAAAWQGRFYQSGDDLEMLDQAIRHWQKYRDHVQTKSRADLARRAEAELSKLEDIRSRLQ